MSELDELYQELILDHNKSPRNFRRLENANRKSEGFNPLCGDHVKVFPRPGLMLIFPAYVWHSVTPHRGEFHRLAFSMNFTLRWPAGSAEQHSLK